MLTMHESVVILGAGNLAASLAAAIKNAGIRVLQVYSRTLEHAQQLALKVEAEPICSLENLKTDVAYYFIALPDDVIPSIVKLLPPLNGIVVHTSGSTPITVLESVNATGYGVFYPFQTFSRNRVISFTSIPVCLEANCADTYSRLEQLASRLTRVIVPMNSEQRRWLHLSGVFACNFTNHMLALAYRLTIEHHISFDVVRPLVEETVRKAFEGNPAHFQTGPAIRNDRQTIERHVQMLEELNLADLYKQLSLSIQNVAKENEK